MVNVRALLVEQPADKLMRQQSAAQANPRPGSLAECRECLWEPVLLGSINSLWFISLLYEGMRASSSP